MTLKDFFKTYTKIVIPHIQRQYAQGRRDKHSTMVREKLVQSIFDHLEKEKNEKNFDLNFIYGSSLRGATDSAEKGEFELLDGQQRITTLFLFYWYLAVREKESIHEKESIFAYLSKFEYRTRTTATEFCHKITAKDFDIRKELETRSPSELLKDQSWFTYTYKCDSTIEGMLVMLDEIHGQYNKREKQDNLFDQLEHVIFSMEDIGDYPDKEDLYTKMNARGLLLTPFENFKADLLEHIKGDKGGAEEYGKWLDGDFLDFFWKIAQTSEKSGNVPPPDPLMMEFVNRFSDVYMIINKNKETTSFPSDYISFEPYKNISGKEWQRLKDIFQFIYEDRNGKKLREDVEKAWEPAWKPNAYVIPSPEKPKPTDKGLCIFAAIYLYVEKLREKEKNALLFKQWMRVCWNIVENIYDSTRKKGSIQLLNRLAGQLNDEQEGSDIYDKLTHINLDQVVTGSKTQRRVLREEIEKAKVFNDYEKTILAAESRFKGSIFFLFAKEYDETNGFRNNLCWGGKDTFEGMLNKAKQLLGEQPPNDIKNNEEEKRKRSLLWANFLFQLSCPPDKIDSDGDKFLRDKQIFDYNNEKEILTETHLLCAIYATISESPKVNPDDCKGWRKGHFRRYSGTINDKELLDFIVQEEPAARLKWRGKLCLYKPHARDGLILGPIGAIRSDVLRGLEKKGKIIISPEAKQGTKNGKLSRYLWGWDIKFTYNGVNYIWHFNDSISKVGEIKEIGELKYEGDEEENIGIAREKFEKDLEKFLMINKTEKSE